jgi:beta-barrel assembly-enhancing protease
MKRNFIQIHVASERCIAVFLVLAGSLLAYGQVKPEPSVGGTVDSQTYLGESQVVPRSLNELKPLFKLERTSVVLYVPPLKVDKKAQKYDITKIGDRGIGKGLNFYSLSKEKEIGLELSQEIEADAKIVTDPLVVSYVEHLGQQLVSHSDARTVFVIKVLDSDVINALALPGGYFYVTTGLVLAADNEAELAAAMAHEIAHVAARHATQNMTKSQIWGLASLALTAVGGPAGIIVHQVADVAVPLSFLKFGRNDEREADLLGLEYQYAAGYDPLAFVNFFERIAAHQKKERNFVVRLWSTHPMTSDRIRRAQVEIETLLPPHDQYVISTNEFDEVKSRVTQLTVGIPSLVNPDSNKPTLRRGRSEQGSTGGLPAGPSDEPALHRK